mmetsp:Transcript_5355/g.10075  ORF Transcript_5355/g.10075 Transcript_5355/m.10075 type:complete len:283 (-) Transcript_5355:1488-2336(-)
MQEHTVIPMTFRAGDSFFTRAMSSSSTISSEASSPIGKFNRRRKVHFVISKFTYIEPDDSFPPADPSDLYYTKEDFASVRLETALTLQMLIAKDPRVFDDESDFCARGVEELSQECSRRRLVSHLRMMRATMREQELQRRTGIFDPEKLAEKARQMSALDRVRAQNQGIQDAQVSRQILFGTKSDQNEDNEVMTGWFQKSAHRKQRESSSSFASQCDSSSTASTCLVDDLSETSFCPDGSESDPYPWDSVDAKTEHFTILDARPNPFQTFIRIFHLKACWYS